MPLSNYAFLIKADGYPASGQAMTLPGDGFTTHIFAASDINTLINASITLIEDGIQLIETCGGFGPDDFAALSDAIGERVALGQMHFDETNKLLLDQLIAD